MNDPLTTKLPPGRDVRGRALPTAARLRDKGLWAFWITAVLGAALYFVGDHLYFANDGVDCYPHCTFTQKLYGWMALAGVLLAAVGVIASIVRWLLLDRRARRNKHSRQR